MNRLSWLLLIVLFLLTTVFLGCTKNDAPNRSAPATASPPPARAEPAFKHAAEQAKDNAAGGKQPPLERKVIFTADVRLIVADFVKAEKELEQLVLLSKGYIAKSDVSGSVGSSRTGNWKLRIPVTKFRDFQEAIKKLGEVQRYTSDANDVTEEYFDLAVRVQNKEAEVADLRKLYEKGSSSVETIAAIRSQLTRVTDELEQMKGRQRAFDNLTELTTLTLQMQERDAYVPTEPVPFDTTVAKTFFGSFEALVKLGKVVALVAVALAPWLPVLAMIILPIWWLWLRRPIKAAPAVVSTASGSAAKVPAE